MYFKLSELLHSETARQQKVENLPEFDDIENIQRLIDDVLDPIRERWGSPIVINSGFRNNKVNKLVKGSSTSQHRYGQAADIVPKRGSVKDLFEMCKTMVEDGEIEVGQLIDEYDYKWVHISLPTDKLHNQILHIK